MLRTPPARTWFGPSGRLRRVLANPMTVPVLMGLVVLLIGAQIAFIYAFPSSGNDETAHLGYVGALAEGHLPTIDTPSVDDPSRFGAVADDMQVLDDAHDDIWTANHPPLFHLLLVPLFRASDGDPGSMFVAMRLVNTVGFAVWIVLVGLVARDLLPRRPAAPALAVLVGLMPTLVLRSAFLINDGMSASASVLMLLMTVRMLTGAVTPTRLAVASAAGVVAAGTRASGVLTVAVCTVVLAVVLWRREGLRRAAVASLVAGGVPALATGWFYLRNLRLYGDLTGEGALLEKFHKEPLTQLIQVWRLPGISLTVETAGDMLFVLALVVPVALLRWLRSPRPRVEPGWVLLALVTAVTVANVTRFIAAGGGFHDRYLMPIMPFPATVGALALLEIGRWRGPADPARRDWVTAAVAGSGLLAWLGVSVAWLEHRYIFLIQSHLASDGTAPAVLAVLGTLAAVLVPVVLIGQVLTMSGERQLSAESCLYSGKGMFQSP